MKISDVMTRECRTCDADAPAADAARLMAERNFGAAPIAHNDKLVGMLTDRDIVVRGAAEGRDLNKTRSGELISGKVYYCYDDQDCGEVARNMGELQVRRMPVVDREKKLVGMVSLGDLATRGPQAEAGEALAHISRPAA